MLSSTGTESPISWYEVTTARGRRRISADDGYVLPHEHVLIDLRVWWEGEGTADVLDPPGDDVVAERFDELRRRPHEVCRENLVLSDWYVAAKELRHAASSGCQMLVDLTTSGLGPTPGLAARAADLAGLNVVLGVGRYVAESLPAEELGRSADQLVDEWEATFETGVDGFPVGVIGEIGTSRILAEPEHHSLVAAARLQHRTGLGINVHLHPYGRQGSLVLDVLERGGADLTRVALSHCDGEIDVSELLKLLHRGCYVELDSFGYTNEWHVGGRPFPSDTERIDAAVELCERGYERQLLLSQDICHKNALRRYGGWGYAHLADTVMPQLLERLDLAVVNGIVRHNPLRHLSGQTSAHS